MRSRLAFAFFLVLAVVAFAPKIALAEPAGFSEWRGLWLNRYEYRNESANALRAKIDEAASLGITDIMFQVRGQGDAYYESSLEPKAPQVSDWDPLAVAVERAHQQGVKLHAWINTMNLWNGTTPPAQGTSPPHPFYNESPSYRIHDLNGDPQPIDSGYVIANPILPEWHDHVNNVADDILSNYDVDGLHLDYTRWPDSPSHAWENLPHDSQSHQLFTQATGLAAISANATAYRNYVRDRITDLVSSLSTTVHGVDADAELSAAVWRDPSIGYNQKLQDYQTWMEEDYLDVVIPMMYLSPTWDHLLEPNLESVLSIETNARVAPGVGVYLHNNPNLTVSQLERMYDHGVDGVTLYYHTSFFESGQLGIDRFNAVKGYLDWVDALDPGDFDQDGDVDGDDFITWQVNYGDFPNGGAKRSQADGNGDGFVDGDDFLIWQSGFGSGGSAAAAVPEPASNWLGCIAIACTLACVGRRPTA